MKDAVLTGFGEWMAAHTDMARDDDGVSARLAHAGVAMPLEEEALVERAIGGDRAAFGLLYDRYCRVIYAYLYSRTGDHVTTEDLTSQTFFQAMASIGRYEQRGLPFKSWLYRIAANAMVSHARKHPAQTAVEEVADPPAPDPQPDEAFLRAERVLGLRAALANLRPEQREAIVLRFGHDLRIKEVAARMGRSEGAVKMLLLRALEALRGRLDTANREGARG